MKHYEDAYYKSFTTGQYAELRAEQEALEGMTTWEDRVNGMSIIPLSTPMDVEVRSIDPANKISKEILLDTADNLKLMIAYSGKEACLRDCAMPSLLSTVEIRGSGVFRPNPEQQAVALTALLTGCRENSRIMTRAGKVSAVVSHRYEPMPISNLLDICDGLEFLFGRADFQSGFVSHGSTVCQFEYPEAAADATKAYRKALSIAGRTIAADAQITPIIEFRSSDTSGEAAKLLTYLKLAPGQLMPIGEGVKVPHTAPLEYNDDGTRMTAMQKFSNEAQLLYSQLEYDIGDMIPKMLQTQIDHPVNTYIGLCKYAAIPQKWGGEIEEELKSDWPDHSGCTFLDVYEAITKVTAKAVEENDPHSQRLLDLEEAISRIARNRAIWKKFDLPGTVAWVQSIKK